MCPEWRDFTAFLRDMGTRPVGMSLDRIDVHGGYSPDNCRWADRVTQARNQTHVVWVEMGEERRPLVEWCEHLGISVNTVRDRVKHYGLTYQEALTRPRQDRVAAARKMAATRSGKK